MATVSDSVLANVTTALKARGMWSNTLVVHLSDNGGPVAANAGASHANNWPLRGGKHSKCGPSFLCMFLRFHHCLLLTWSKENRFVLPLSSAGRAGSASSPSPPEA